MRFLSIFFGFLFFSLQSTPLANAKDIGLLNIEGSIHKGTVRAIEQSIEISQSKDFQALLITLNTPGGMLDATRSIVQAFLSSPLPIIVFVHPPGAHAGSAGTFITMAAHVAAMANGTNIGAAHPVTATGKDPEADGGEHLAKKIENDVLAFMDAIAKERDRNVEWGRKAILESDSISQDKALKLKVIDIVARSKDDLLTQINGRTVKLNSGKEISLATEGTKLREIELPAFTQFQNWLASPSVMFILLLLAGLGLYLEFSNPGGMIPGAVGVFALGLIFLAQNAIPLSWIGIALFVLAFIFFILEVYTPSFGVFSILGLAAFVAGSLMLFNPDMGEVKVPYALLTVSTISLASLAAYIVFSVAQTFGSPQRGGPESLIGSVVDVVQEIPAGGEGKIYFNGEYWTARSNTPLAKGQKAKLVEFKGMLAMVTEI